MIYLSIGVLIGLVIRHTLEILCRWLVLLPKLRRIRRLEAERSSVPNEPCAAPLDQCRFSHAEHTRYFMLTRRIENLKNCRQEHEVPNCQ